MGLKRADQVVESQDEAAPDTPNSGVAAAFDWSGDESERQRLQEQQSYHYLRWTFFVGIAVVIVSIIGVGLTLLH